MPWFLTPHGPHFVVEPGTIDEYERRDYVQMTAQQAVDYFAGVAFPDPPSFATEAEVPGIMAAVAANPSSAFSVAQRAAFEPLRKPTIVLMGDSRTAFGSYSIGGATVRAHTTNQNWFSWGQWAAARGPVFDVIRNSGVISDTTTGMLARFQADVINQGPSHVTLWGGTNDGWTTTAHVDASYGRMVQMMEMARAAGIYVFLISEIPASTRGTGFPALIQYYNEKLRNYAATNPGVEFWDFASVITDPTNANGYPKAPMMMDGLHLSVLGAATVGFQAVAPRLARFGAALAALPNSLIDASATASSRNANPNPLMTGTTGTLGSGHTGTLPTGWTSGGLTATFTTPARSDGIGNNLRAAITAASAGTFFANIPLDPARFVSGKSYVIEAALDIESPVALNRVALNVELAATPSNFYFGVGYQQQTPVAGDTVPARSGLIIRSQKFTVPAGLTVTAAPLILAVGFNAAGSATINLGRLAVKAVD